MKKLSLNQLSKSELEKREMSQLMGGGVGNCRCGCAGNHSLTDANADANKDHGYTITNPGGGGVGACWCLPGSASIGLMQG